jgi:hypothetical protein
MNKYVGIKSRAKSEEPEEAPIGYQLGTTEWVGIWLVVMVFGGLCAKLWAAFGGN